MSTVISIADRTVQLVPPSTFANRTVLRFVDVDDPAVRTRFTMPHDGRTLVEVWLSTDWPADPTRANLAAALPSVPSAAALTTSAGRTALNAWMKAADKAIRGALAWEPPMLQCVITRYPVGVEPDYTLRCEPMTARPGKDNAFLYVAEFDTDPDIPFSIDAYHDGKASVPIDAKNLHITPIATGSSYR